MDKACIYGFIERGGRVQTIHIRKFLKKGMELLLKKFLDTFSILYTEEYKAYRGLDKMFKSYKVVNQGAYQYVDRDKTLILLRNFEVF